MPEEGVAYNSGNLHLTADDVQSNLTVFDNNVNVIMEKARGLKERGYWAGEVYDTFITDMEAYKKDHIDTLEEDIKSQWINKLHAAGEGADENTAKGRNIVG